MGTSCNGNYGNADRGDHPHAYGDKDRKKAKGQQKIGSSPRVWGQAMFANRMKALNRIIPTRMGTSINYKFMLCLS